ncbi:CGNR zinc finger domain-containing protein [Streptomyces tirandamycinicus]|uniref:CGNR zinc finger domain-containing protein n=1 Tax=Streptomyces tirandamycinicus TaxID=2174846 RepID=UPI00226D4FA5|nr:CGNR zinc finger domain-containing protein [Streptomyces tirandamycinicus]MCY0985031.1 CGNR zinc finger domain-containing protein [Streptomyces tirandamycinicus]
MRHAFPGGTPALDFSGTLRFRHRVEPQEDLDSPESLGCWFRECGITERDIPCGAADLREAVTLREAIHRLVAARMSGEVYDRDALALVNEHARQPTPVPQLTETGRHVEATVGQALACVARDAVGVLGDPDVPLKECAAPDCSQIFVDRSRGARREWCAMDPCGNRIKAAAYRARKRVSGQGERRRVR